MKPSDILILKQQKKGVFCHQIQSELICLYRSIQNILVVIAFFHNNNNIAAIIQTCFRKMMVYGSLSLSLSLSCRHHFHFHLQF